MQLSRIREKSVSDSQINSEKILKDLNIKLNKNIEKSLNSINEEKSIVLKDIFNECFEISN